MRNNLDAIQLGPNIMIEDSSALPTQINDVRRTASRINLTNKEDLAKRMACLDKLKQIRAMVDVENDLIRQI